MPTKKHRYMIILDEETNMKLIEVMYILHIKQRSKAIWYLINLYSKKAIKEYTELINKIIK